MKYDTHVKNPFVLENYFLKKESEQSPLPQFNQVKKDLPQPYWEGHDQALTCYWKTWELAFKNLRQASVGSGFVSNFIDTAFNNCLFMWDSAFIVMFGRYGSRVFNFQKTLDNFYSHQHRDGFICRELQESDGEDRFERFDPASTGPNIMPWAEWEYFLNFGDLERLKNVFPCLVAFNQWFGTYRSWPDGTYYSSGWGCGMDNQPRVRDPNSDPAFSHGHLSWLDTTLQQIFAGKILLQMAAVLNRTSEIKDIQEEVITLSKFVNEKMWDNATAFYYDRKKEGQLLGLKSIGAYWALLAGIVPEHHQSRFIGHLKNPREFNRPHLVPTLSADDPAYSREGSYWLGSVWAPTNYMVLQGLRKIGQEDLAFQIGENHHRNVVEVFEKTGTLWENYAPEQISQGNHSRKDFVGWTGLPPIAVLFEYIFGLQPDVPHNRIILNVNVLEEHGVTAYPYGPHGVVDFRCAKRKVKTEEPSVEFKSTIPIEVVIKWDGGKKIKKI